jgi:hypothetical protein
MSTPKTLFIASQESDYLQDTVYSGLREILGKENICDFPLRPSFHRPDKEYPRNLGLPSNPNDQLNWVQLLGRKWNKPDFKNFEVAILGCAKPEAFESYLSVQKLLPDHCRLIFLDGGDRPEIAGDLERLGKPELYQESIRTRPFDFIFKREYLLTASHPENVTPLPFGLNTSLLPKHKTETMPWLNDVTFWAVESDPIRTQALTLIQDRFDCRKNDSVRNQTFRKYKRKGLAYLQELKQSKITLNFRGVGWDTLRYWEVTALGRFLVSQKPQIVIPNNFRHGKEIVFCQDSLSDLVELCEYYLKNETEREQIAKAAYEHFIKFHTHVARAKTVIDTAFPT